jgi:hypothetical protein
MKSDDDARGGATRPHLDAKQCELLKALPNPETTFGRAHRDSLAEAMIDLILGPDAA